MPAGSFGIKQQFTKHRFLASAFSNMRCEHDSQYIIGICEIHKAGSKIIMVKVGGAG